MDQIWVGSFKLRANYIRYHREEARKDMSVEVSRRANTVKVQPKQNISTRVVGQNTYAEALKGSGKAKVWQKKVVDQEVWTGIDFTVKEEDFIWLEKCYVGYVHNPDAVYLL